LSASFRQVGGTSAARILARQYAPETNGEVERSNQSLTYEHLYQREIDHAATLAEEVEAFLAMFNEVRPHESLAWRQPLAMRRADAHLFQAPSLQDH
jgi:transposase InsO family protein